MASIREVATRAGVSPATVSRTFSTPDLINEQTRKSVLEVARQMNYKPPRQRTPARPSSVSRSVNRREAIGFQFFAPGPNQGIQTNTFYGEVLTGAQSEAATLNLNLLFHMTDRHTLVQGLPKMIEEESIGGMLLVGTADPAVIDTFANNIPHLILVDTRDIHGRHECVLSDGFGGAYETVRYLLQLGHRRIAFFQPELDAPTFQDRLRGYLCALFEAGIPIDPALVWNHPAKADAHADSAPLFQALTQRLSSPDRPTALVTANDHYAIQVIGICRGLGLRIPDDISLAGFDDIYMVQHLDPPLTTVRVDKVQMGRFAVRRLYERLHADVPEGYQTPAVRHDLPISLIVRGSCASL